MNEKELREIKRRFRPDKSNIPNIVGCFINGEGQIISRFSQSILLSENDESEALLSVMKKTLSGSLGTNLIDIEFSTRDVTDGEEHKLLMKLRDSHLRDEGALTDFFTRVAESVHIESNYVVLLANDIYDVYTKENDEVYISGGKLFVCDGWSGEASTRINSYYSNGGTVSSTYGQVVTLKDDLSYTSGGNFTGDLRQGAMAICYNGTDLKVCDMAMVSNRGIRTATTDPIADQQPGSYLQLFGHKEIHVPEVTAPGVFPDFWDALSALEILEQDWLPLLDSARGSSHRLPEIALERLTEYFLFRWLLKAINDGDLLGRMQLSILSALTVERLAGRTATPEEALYRYCREIEHCEENIDSLLDAFRWDQRFSPERLLSELQNV